MELNAQRVFNVKMPVK